MFTDSDLLFVHMIASVRLFTPRCPYYEFYLTDYRQLFMAN